MKLAQAQIGSLRQPVPTARQAIINNGIADASLANAVNFSSAWTNETLSVAPMGVSNKVCSCPRALRTGWFTDCGRSIVRFDRPFDNLGFLSDKFRQMLFYIVGSQVH